MEQLGQGEVRQPVRRTTPVGASRRATLRAAATGVGAALLAACGVPGSGSDAPAPSAEPVTVRLHSLPSGAEGAYWPRVVESFNARGTRVRAAFEPWSPGSGAVAMGVAGTLGDVMRLVGFGGDYSEMAVKGFVREVESLVQRDRYNLRQFYPASVDTLRFRDKLYGLPHIAHPGFCGHFTNLDLLGQAGVPVPDETTWTFSSLVDVGKRVHATLRSGGAEDKWGMWAPTNLQHVMVAARAYGGDTLSRDGKRSLITEPAAVEGIEFIADLTHRHLVAPTPTGLAGNAVNHFISGNVGLLWWNVGAFPPLASQTQGLRWRLLLGPKASRSRGFFLGVDSVSMSATSKHPAEAFEFMKHAVTKEVSVGWLEHGFPPGARPDSWNDPKVTADAGYRVLARAMDESAPLNLPHNGLLREYNAALTAALNDVWSGKVNARTGAEAARRAGQEVLDRA